MKRILKIMMSAALLLCGLDAAAQSKNMDFLDAHIYVASDVNGARLNMAFDTGSPYLCLDSITVESGVVPYKMKTRALAGGAGNQKVTIPLIVDKIPYTFVGNNHVSSMTPIFEIKPILGDHCDGLVGIDAVRGKVLAIDYLAQSVSVTDALPADIATYSFVDVEITDDRIYLPITVVAGTATVSGRALLDLGSGGSVTLTSATAAQHNLAAVQPSWRYEFLNGGIGGGASGVKIYAQSVALAGQTLENVLVDYSLNTDGALSARDYVAIVGNSLLCRFDMVVDWNGGRLYLRPNADFGKPFKMSEFGFVNTDRSRTLGCWVVNCLYEDSAAMRAGLRLGDRIKTFNGRDVADISIREQQLLFEGLTRVELVVGRDGERLEIVIEN